MNRYNQTKTCSGCGYTDRRLLDKTIAAFESTRKWQSPCPKCLNSSIKSAHVETPPLDSELLTIWADSPDLTFSMQDEDIILADPENYDLLTEYVLNKSVPARKREILLSAICVLLFDNTPDGESDVDVCNTQIAEKTRTFLSENKFLFDELNEIYLSDYIKIVVFPQIGLK